MFNFVFYAITPAFIAYCHTYTLFDWFLHSDPYNFLIRFLSCFSDFFVVTYRLRRQTADYFVGLYLALYTIRSQTTLCTRTSISKYFYLNTHR